MKHRGPGSSLHPAREAARANERSQLPAVSTPAMPTGDTSALVGAAARTAQQINGWELGTDPDGNLTAAYQGGTPHVIARRDDDDDEENE